MKVVKNTLAKIAAKDTPFECMSDAFVQTRAFVYNDKDVVASAKVLTKQAKNYEKLNLIVGTLVTNGKGKLLDVAGVEALSKLPSKEELIAKLLFVFNAPITQFVRTLNEVPASFARVLQAIADSKNEA
jgi:large subunit ribosomal protein L10